MPAKTRQENLIGAAAAVNEQHFSRQIAFHDGKIRFLIKHCKDKDVLDLGCVQHNPQNYQSKYWIFRALQAKARSVVGLDLYAEGVAYLQKRGFDVICADAQTFDLGRHFDVIVAGDLIEHLEDFHGFFESCKTHLRPDGCLLVTTPNPWFWRQWVKALWRTEVGANPEHTCWLCPQTLRQLAERHNFRVGEIAYFSRRPKDRYLPLPKRWKHMTFGAKLYISSVQPNNLINI